MEVKSTGGGLSVGYLYLGSGDGAHLGNAKLTVSGGSGGQASLVKATTIQTLDGDIEVTATGGGNIDVNDFLSFGNSNAATKKTTLTIDGQGSKLLVRHLDVSDTDITVSGGGLVEAKAKQSEADTFRVDRGTLKITGANSKVDLLPTLNTDLTVDGTVQIESQGELASNGVRIGVHASSSTAKLTVDGTGRFSATSNVYVGDKTSGLLKATNGASVSALAPDFILGNESGVTGQLEISGSSSRVEATNIVTGNKGTGTATLTSGHFGGTTGYAIDISLAKKGGSYGTLTMSTGDAGVKVIAPFTGSAD